MKIRNYAPAMTLAALLSACGATETPTSPSTTTTTTNPSPSPTPGPTPAPQSVVACVMNAGNIQAPGYSVDNAAATKISGVTAINVSTGEWYIFQGGAEPQLRRDVTFTPQTSDNRQGLEAYLKGVSLNAVDKLYYKPGSNRVEVYSAISKMGERDVVNPLVTGGVAKTSFTLGGESYAAGSSSIVKTYTGTLPTCR